MAQVLESLHPLQGTELEFLAPGTSLVQADVSIWEGTRLALSRGSSFRLGARYPPLFSILYLAYITSLCSHLHPGVIFVYANLGAAAIWVKNMTDKP